MEDKQQMAGRLDLFEETLEAGLYKICNRLDLKVEPMSSPDIDGKWEEFLKPYAADAIENVNDYPDAALGFAAYLGMAVAHCWDTDWKSHMHDKYSSFYGPRGYDDMDDHIVADILGLDILQTRKRAEILKSCTASTMGLLRHEEIDLRTEFGFYALVRCFGAFFRLGVSIQLCSTGYRKEFILPSQNCLS